MKVLDDKAKKWVYALPCPHCKSELAITAGDIYEKYIDGVETYSTYYQVNCGACKVPIDLTKDSNIPQWVRTTAAKRRSVKK